MKKILVAGLMFLALFVQTREDNELVYIVPNLHSTLNCSHNQLCLTFQQFVESLSRTVENVTMAFKPGYHTLTTQDIYRILNTNLVMMGTSAEAIIHDALTLNFIGVKTLQIENLMLSNNDFNIFRTQQLSLFSVTLDNCNIYITKATTVQLHDCEFYDSIGPLIVVESNVTLSGNSKFFNCSSALVAYRSAIVLSGIVSFVNNSGIRGGAMALYSSTIYTKSGLNVSFINNSAEETGGAIHIEPDMTRAYDPGCFYQIEDNDTGIEFHYYKNSAQFGGDNIYGTSLSCFCRDTVSHYFLSNASMSSVASDPTQVCLCDSDGQPQCKKASNKFNKVSKIQSIHPGETFIVSAVLVGGDHGTTTGVVHASFVPTNLLILPFYQYSQWIDNNSVCTDLEYTIYTKEFGENFTMHLAVQHSKRLKAAVNSIVECDVGYSHITQTCISFAILPCPMGFSLLENPFICDCNPMLTHSGVKCSIINRRSYFSWNTTLWINLTDTGFIYTKYCPLHYCNPAGKQIELENDPSAQCTFNRASRLCGGCKEGYSLAIGSSHCIHCPNNNSLILLIFFAAGGFLLVFFINIFDITPAQGLLDGLIFYANIVWTYQSVLFPEGHASNIVIIFLETFIAWINLDFGIETCFVKGLTSYWKTWLQFTFPFYIWAIVGLMVVSAKYSNTLTKLYGNRVVSVLATLFLLSYMKLLRTVTFIYMFSNVFQYPEKSKVTVWSVDGNVDYFGLPHSLLLVAALTVQIFLWLPYTLTLLLHQQLQKVSQIRAFKWVTQLKPFFDVHFAPFKPAHRYWFGVLLLARGILLIVFSTSLVTPKNTNLLFLLIILIILLLYMAIVQPYRNKIILIIQSSFLANILFLGILVFYAETHANKHTLQTTAVGISIGVTFFQFCGIIICNVIRLCRRKKCNSRRYRANLGDEEELEENFSTTYRAYIMKALF